MSQSLFFATLQISENFGNILNKTCPLISFDDGISFNDGNTFHLVDDAISFDDIKFGSKEVDDELEIITLKEDMLSLESLNDAMQHAYHSVLDKVFSPRALHFLLMALAEQGKHFYTD